MTDVELSRADAIEFRDALTRAVQTESTLRRVLSDSGFDTTVLPPGLDLRSLTGRVFDDLANGAEPGYRALLATVLSPNQFPKNPVFLRLARDYAQDLVPEPSGAAPSSPPAAGAGLGAYPVDWSRPDVQKTAQKLTGREIGLVRDAVICSYDYQDLEQYLLVELDQRLDVISAPGNFKDVVFRVLVTAGRQGWLWELLDMFRKGSYPAVREVAERILVAHISVPGGSTASESGEASPGISAPGDNPAAGLSQIPAGADPYLRFLIGQQQPFIDRSVLRVHLKDLLSDSPSRVLVITGDRPCGKSYTWFFIRQPELLAGMTPVLVDLSEWANPSRPIEVMSSVALQLGLREPNVDGHAQGAAKARLLRDWLVGQLQQHDRDGRWLLVFDSLDHAGQRDETLQLIEFLAGAAIRQRLTGLRVILLGYANRLPVDPLESVLTERIRDIGEPELRDFFRLLAQHAELTISDDAIAVAANGVLSLLPLERERKLCQLAKTVRVVGNAAFGQKVL